MTSSSPSKPRRLEPELELVPLAKITRKSVERLAPFCQMRLPQNSTPAPLIQKTNRKILEMIQAIDTSMLVAQIGFRLANEAAAMCDPFVTTSHPHHPHPHPHPHPHSHSHSNSTLSLNKIVSTNAATSSINGLNEMGNSEMITPEILQTMAAHGHAHALRTSETFRDVAQKIYKIAAVTKDSEILVIVPPDPQQPAIRQISLKEVGTSLVANLNLLTQYSRAMLELTSWWEWLEEELMSPDSTLLPSSSPSHLSSTPTQQQQQTNQTQIQVIQKGDIEQFSRWSKIKGGYLDYYTTIGVVYTRYPQLLTTSNSAWQSISSLPMIKSSPGSSWDGHGDYEMITSPSMIQLLDSTSSDEGGGGDKDKTEGVVKSGKEVEGVARDAKLNENGDEKKVKSEGGIDGVDVVVEKKSGMGKSKFKAVAGKVGLLKVFGRRKGKGKGKSKEEASVKPKENDENTETVSEDVLNVEQKQDKGKGKDVEDMEQVTNKTVTVAPLPTITITKSTHPPVNEEAPEDTSEPQQAIQPPLPLSSSSSSSSSSSTSSPKPPVAASSKSKQGGLSKILASLKDLFAKLSCQNANHIQG